MTAYLAIAGQVVGNDRVGFRTEFHALGNPHRTKKGAISEGFRRRGSDDFNVGVVKNDTLTAIFWMDDDLHEPPDVLARASWHVGLKGDPS